MAKLTYDLLCTFTLISCCYVCTDCTIHWRKDHFISYWKSFTFMPSCDEKLFRRLYENLQTMCISVVSYCQLSILQQISGPMFHIFVETPTSVWVSLLGTCIFLPIRYVSSLSFIWYKKFSFAILYRYSPIVWNYLLLKSHN